MKFSPTFLGSVVALSFVATWTLPAIPAAAQENPSFEIWPGKVPGEKDDIGPEKATNPPGSKIIKVESVTKPTVTVFAVPEDKRNGAAVVVCPGGGYNILAWDLEGTEVANWLNSFGVTAFVLKYRVPRRKDQAPHLAPLQDAQRALSLVRARAKEWGVDPNKIGILGFSAGGHLSAATSTNFDRRAYENQDSHDQTSCRPDFTVLIYPAYLQKDMVLSEEIRVGKETPPAFLAHAHNDGIGPENSIAYYLALKKSGIPAELHIYSTGGHGFGLRPTDHPCSTWPARCAAWMVKQGIVPAP